MSLKKLHGKILTSMVLGLVVMMILSLFSDLHAVGGSLGHFAWLHIPVVLSLVLINYCLRWVKWEYFLRRLRLGHSVRYSDSVLIFTSGMIMAVTPGKVGEVFKSYLLRRVNGTPVSLSAPIVLVERLTDGLAMLLLMALGLTLYSPARPLFFLLLALSCAGIALLQYRSLCTHIIDRWLTRLPSGQALAPKLVNIYTSTYQLLNWRVLLLSTGLSLVSWGLECLAFYFVLTGLGQSSTGLLLLQATFIYAASTLLGLVSFLPGGLGATEASSAGLLVTLVGMSASAGTAATIIIRFCTLWFGVAVGAVGLIWFSQRYHPGEMFELEQTVLEQS